MIFTHACVTDFLLQVRLFREKKQQPAAQVTRCVYFLFPISHVM